MISIAPAITKHKHRHTMLMHAVIACCPFVQLVCIAAGSLRMTLCMPLKKSPAAAAALTSWYTTSRMPAWMSSLAHSLQGNRVT